MNTNSNTYTVIYTTILVVVVAAVLAVVSSVLKPMQNANVTLEKQKTILRSANIEGKDAASIEALYAKHITGSFILDLEGNKVEGNAFDVDLKAQFNALKKGEDAKLPVFICTLEDGSVLNIFPCYGAGLWGAIWGYVSVESDFKTVHGAVFDHASETPGLGAKIAEAPFYNSFKGKVLAKDGAFNSIQVVKGGANGDPNGVDAIAGATITSKALEGAIAQWLEAYKPYIDNELAIIASETVNE